MAEDPAGAPPEKRSKSAHVEKQRRFKNLCVVHQWDDNSVGLPACSRPYHVGCVERRFSERRHWIERHFSERLTFSYWAAAECRREAAWTQTGKGVFTRALVIRWNDRCPLERHSLILNGPFPFFSSYKKELERTSKYNVITVWWELGEAIISHFKTISGRKKEKNFFFTFILDNFFLLSTWGHFLLGHFFLHPIAMRDSKDESRGN